MTEKDRFALARERLDQVRVPVPGAIKLGALIALLVLGLAVVVLSAQPVGGPSDASTKEGPMPFEKHAGARIIGMDEKPPTQQSLEKEEPAPPPVPDKEQQAPRAENVQQ